MENAIDILEYADEEMDEEEEEISPQETTERRRRRRRRKKVRRFSFTSISGVVRLELSEATQTYIECIVGTDVTGQNPWKSIAKDLLIEHINYTRNSEFLPFQEQIAAYPHDELYVGYVVNEASDIDEFYLCLSLEGHEIIAEKIIQDKEDLILSIYNITHRKIKKWRSRGSEPEVEAQLDICNRPLIQVELVSEFPIMASEVVFRLRKAEDISHGYAEILCERQTFQNVWKSRIDCCIQAVMAMTENSAQTICTFPKNTWTSYEYEEICNENFSPVFLKNFKEFSESSMEILDNDMLINSVINFYADEYKQLVMCEDSTVVRKVSYRRKLMSFTDIKVCKDKMITAISWHPMWSGIVALAYADFCLSNYITESTEDDLPEKTIFNPKPLLLWSLVDGLYPKLYLDSDRTITSLSFCPYNENILIGGLRTGQVCIWDLRGKLERVETEEILNEAQRKYRVLMHSLISWMKDIFNIDSVPYTAVSSLEFSHDTAITAISWISPFYEITNTGQFKKLPEGKQSLQFITASRDGNLLVWNLLAKPKATTASTKASKKHRHLKKRPSALTLETSSFRDLHRNLIPSYRIKVLMKHDCPISISSLSIKFEPCQYEELPDKENPPKRKYFKANPVEPKFEVKPEFCVGTLLGDVIWGAWEGFNFNTGEMVNSEDCKIIQYNKFHGASVTSVDRCSITDVVLTVGGKTFAIWREGYAERPVIWRKSQYYYTSGSFNTIRPVMFKLTKRDGSLESWHLISRSDAPISCQSIAAESLTDCATHPRDLTKNILGVADSHGTFRLFSAMPYHSFYTIEQETEFLNKLLDRELDIKIQYIEWQKKWLEKYMKKKDDSEIMPMEPENPEVVIISQATEPKTSQKPQKAGKELDCPYYKWERQQWDKREQDRMNRVLLAKKHLDKEKLIAQQLPLKLKAEDEEQRKLRLQKHLSKGDHIFNESVSMYFPEAVKKKKLPPPDPYKSQFKETEKENCFALYTKMKTDAEAYVQKWPYNYVYCKNAALAHGKEIRQFFDSAITELHHRERHQELVKYRNLLERGLDDEKGKRRRRRSDGSSSTMSSSQSSDFSSSSNSQESTKQFETDGSISKTIQTETV